MYDSTIFVVKYSNLQIKVYFNFINRTLKYRLRDYWILPVVDYYQTISNIPKVIYLILFILSSG